MNKERTIDYISINSALVVLITEMLKFFRFAIYAKHKAGKVERRLAHVCNVINPDANKASMSHVPKELDCSVKKQEIIWTT